MDDVFTCLLFVSCLSAEALCCTAGFVGVDEFSWHASGALLAINTFGSHILITCAQTQLGTPVKQSVKQTCLATLVVRTLNAWVTASSAALQRRHLMVWALFAPRFLFELCFLGIVDVVMVVCTAYDSV